MATFKQFTILATVEKKSQHFHYLLLQNCQNVCIRFKLDESDFVRSLKLLL